MIPEVPQRRGRVLRASTAGTASPLHPEFAVSESFDCESGLLNYFHLRIPLKKRKEDVVWGVGALRRSACSYMPMPGSGCVC
jgi:hypothetical protein